MILQITKQYLPAFEIDQYPYGLCVYTVLCLGGHGDDCAAYRGIGPDMSTRPDDLWPLLEKVRAHGDKISEPEARKVFDLTHEGQPLEYRR